MVHPDHSFPDDAENKQKTGIIASNFGVGGNEFIS